MELAEKLGSLVGQVEGRRISGVAVEVEGAAAQLNQKPITGAVLAGLMRVYSDTVNMVNAPFLAKERGLDLREIRHDREGDYHTLVRVTVDTPDGPRAVAGTLFGNAAPRLVDMFGIAIEAELHGEMIYIVNEDAPGFIGRLGTAARRAGRQHRHLPPRPARGGRRGGRPGLGRRPYRARNWCKRLEAIDGVKRVKPLRF